MRFVPVAWANPASWMREVAQAVNALISNTQFTGTVSELPTGATEGARGYVTDANATTFRSVVAGGGSNRVPVFYDGTDWRIG